MDNQEINRFMAGIIGWTMYDGGEHGCDPDYPHFDIWGDGRIVYSLDSLLSFVQWNPAENVAQAIEAIEVYCEQREHYLFTLRRMRADWIAIIHTSMTGPDISARDDAPALAVCKILIKEVG